MKNKVLVIICLLLVIACINGVSATGTFYLDPQHGTSALGSDVVMNLNFTTDVGFKSCNADLTIDPTIVKITCGDTTGPGTSPAFTLESGNYKPGCAPNTYRIAFVDLQYPDGGAPAGTYCLAKLTFSPVTVGVSNMKFTGLACTDQTGTPDTCVAIDGTFSGYAVARTQSWYLTDRSAEALATNSFYMDKGYGEGTVNIPADGRYKFIANGPAEVTCDMSGIWKTNIQCWYYGNGTCYGTATMLLLDKEGNFEEIAYAEGPLSSDKIFNNDIVAPNFEIKAGEYLAFTFALWFNVGTERILVTKGESFITSPKTAAAYPIPEPSTYILFIIGGLVLLGYCVFSRRGKRNEKI